MDYWRRHLKRIKSCGQSERWWDAELSRQVKMVQRTRRNWHRVRHRNVLQAEIMEMKQMVREK